MITEISDVEKAAILRTVALTLQQIAGWGDAGPDNEQGWLDLAREVEQLVPGYCCPMCQEVECDAGCPLETVRAEDQSIRMLAVHPALWGDLLTWLGLRGLVVGQIPATPGDSGGQVYTTSPSYSRRDTG